MNVGLIPTPYKILAGILMLLFLMAGSAGVAWRARGWRDDSLQLKQANNDISNLYTQFNTVVGASNQLADRIATSNRVTDASIATLTTAIGEQYHAISQVQVDIRSLRVGKCSFTPAADQLYERAYQAAFGAPADPAPEKGKAGGSHASH